MFIVTAASNGDLAGCLVGFLTQASIDPPRLLVLLSKTNRTFAVARSASNLAIHFLHERNYDLAVAFGERTGDDFDKFAGRTWHRGPAGTAILDGTRGWVTGRIIARVDTGDHVAHLLHVDNAEIDTPGRQLDYQTVREIEPGHPA